MEGGSTRGLTREAAQQLLAQVGPNEIEEKREGLVPKVLRSFASPITLMLVAASGLSFAAQRSFDGGFILFLLLLNVGITLWHEGKADRALDALRAKLTVSAKVMRDGAWKVIDSRQLVPGDFVECGVGDVVPADVRIEEAVNCELDQAVLTGESLPKDMRAGDTAYSGSNVVAGLCRGTVSATGARTYFGKIIGSIEPSAKRSSMEREIIGISKYLMIMSLAAIALLTAALLFEHQDALDIMLLDLSLLIAGLPISLPTVMTLIVSLGAVALAEKQALVRRLAALEDLANVNLLLTDKTGTLTESSIKVDEVIAREPYTQADVLDLAALGLPRDDRNLIDRALLAAAHADTNASIISFTPADSSRKRTTALVERSGKKLLISNGMPEIVAGLCELDAGERRKLAADVATLAKSGARVIAIAMKERPADENDERGMRLVGLVALSDPLRPEAAEVIAFLKQEGIDVKMMTGDGLDTTRHIAGILGLQGQVLAHGQFDAAHMSAEELARVGAFAAVFPDDKLALTKAAQARWSVAVTGDGINDLPAIKEADVGIAVQNAVDALKGAADLVLLEHGISVIKDALIEARKIFFRLFGYSTYRISESFRLVITVLVLGFLYANFPLTPVELIMLALLNDIPIITLAFDRVKDVERPAEIPKARRFILGSCFGVVGVVESLTLFFLLFDVLHLPWQIVQTAFFLKLTVSGHLLIYVAHTRERWYKFLPDKRVILATTVTQLAASSFAFFGFFVAPISLGLIIFVWLWTLVWMQAAEVAKVIAGRLERRWESKRSARQQAAGIPAHV